MTRHVDPGGSSKKCLFDCPDEVRKKLWADYQQDIKPFVEAVEKAKQAVAEAEAGLSLARRVQERAETTMREVVARGYAVFDKTATEYVVPLENGGKCESTTTKNGDQ